MSESETRPDGPEPETAPDRSSAAEPESRTRTREEPAPRPTASPEDPLRGSRTSGIWLAVVASGVILVLLIIFIAQNTDQVQIRFLGWEGQTPLAVALLIATVGGLFLAAVAGSLRILQLRRRVRRGSR